MKSQCRKKKSKMSSGTGLLMLYDIVNFLEQFIFFLRTAKLFFFKKMLCFFLSFICIIHSFSFFFTGWWSCNRGGEEE